MNTDDHELKLILGVFRITIPQKFYRWAELKQLKTSITHIREVLIKTNGASFELPPLLHYFSGSLSSAIFLRSDSRLSAMLHVQMPPLFAA